LTCLDTYNQYLIVRDSVKNIIENKDNETYILFLELLYKEYELSPIKKVIMIHNLRYIFEESEFSKKLTRKEIIRAFNNFEKSYFLEKSYFFLQDNDIEQNSDFILFKELVFYGLSLKDISIEYFNFSYLSIRYLSFTYKNITIYDINYDNYKSFNFFTKNIFKLKIFLKRFKNE